MNVLDFAVVIPWGGVVLLVCLGLLGYNATKSGAKK